MVDLVRIAVIIIVVVSVVIVSLLFLYCSIIGILFFAVVVDAIVGIGMNVVPVLSPFAFLLSSASLPAV